MSTCPVCLGAGQSVNADETATPCSLCEGTGELRKVAPTCSRCEHVRVDHAPTRRDGVGPKGRGACMRRHCECVGYRSRLADETGL